MEVTVSNPMIGREAAAAQRLDAVEQKIRNYIAQSFLFDEEQPLGLDDSLMEAQILDSTAAMEMVAFLEQSFGISISEQEISVENLDTVRRICALIERKSQASAAA